MTQLSKGLKELIDAANYMAIKAETIIKEAYHYAIQTDKLTPEEARKVLYENLAYSPQWISKFLPEEAKQKQIHDKSKEVETRKAKAVSPFLQDKPKEVENITIPQREEIIQDAETEATKDDYYAIMEKKECLKFLGELRIDLSRMNMDGAIQFKILSGELTYKLL